jgi:hypothetical protein
MQPAFAAAQDSYYVGARAGVDMLKSPYSSAKVIQHLPRLQDVSILTKRHSWWKIKTVYEGVAKQGWVPAGAIRKRYQAKHQSTSSGIAAFFSLFKRAPSKRETAVLGVRGLDNEAKLGKADKASLAAVEWMEKLQVADKDVSEFVREGDLNP